MKKNLKSILCVAAAAMTLASCGVKEITPEVKPEGRVVYFGTEVNDLTKASLTTEDDANFIANWENNDALEVAGFDRGSHIANFPAVWDSEKEAFAASGDVEYFFDEPYDFIGVYPQPEEGVIDFGSARTQDGNNYAGKYDVMLSEATSLTLVEGETFVLPMDRQTAIAYFHLTSTLPEDEKIVSATLSVNENLAGSFIYDEGEIATDATENSITLSFTNAPSIKDLRLWFNIFPGEYTGLKLEVETEKHTLTIQNPNKVAYEQGKLYKVAANATAKYEEKEEPDGTAFEKVTSALEDWSGMYLIVYEPDNLAMDGSLSSFSGTNTVGVTISNNAIELNEDTANYLFVVAKEDNADTYTIKSQSQFYIGQTSDANGIQANKTTKYSNALSIESDNTANIVSSGAYMRLNPKGVNNTDPTFRYYKSSTYTAQKAISLYKLNGKFNPDFPTLTVANQEIASNVINVSVPVASNRDWTAEITEGAEYVENNVLSVASGSGDGAIEFRFVSSNTSISVPRVVRIHVVAGTKEADITVTQKVLGAQLVLEKSEDNLAAEATEYCVNVTSANFAWEVLSYSVADEEQTITEANCVKKINPDFSGSVTIRFSSNVANPSATAARIIKVTVGYPDVIAKSISVTQDGDAPQQTDGWIETELSSITEDDIFVITSGGYALSSANGANSSPAAVEVTVMGNAITSEVTDVLKWTLVGNAIDGYSFLANGDVSKKLFVNTTATSKDNDKVRVGTGTRCVFTPYTSGAVYTLKTKDSNPARYIHQYNNQDWRGYLSGTQENTSLKFFVFNDSRTPQSLSYDATTGSIDMNGDVRSLPSLNASGAVTEITYSSSKPEVATVDVNTGEITAVAPGVTIITATAAADETHQSASAKFELTVSNSQPYITLLKTSASIGADASANASITSAYTVTNATDADITVTYEGNITAASVSNGTVYYSISKNASTTQTAESKLYLALSDGIKHAITITQAKAQDLTGWIEVTSISSITPGTYVIAWVDNNGSTYYYLPTTAASSNPAVGKSMTVANGKITSTVLDSMKWTFSGDNTNGFTIASGSNNLCSDDKAQGISIKSTVGSSTSTWKFAVDSTYGLTATGAGTRCLAVYNSGSWRYYAKGSSYVGKLHIFKLVE